MDSPQSVVSPFRSSVLGEKHNSEVVSTRKSSPFSKDIEVNGREAVMSNEEEFLGVLDVFIHQARDIQNICIYHKQDVYAKICLTSNPENTVSTKTINGGGRNPVFNENLRINVSNVDSSLKCEIWMLSRVKNYLEDQLLGFALVPLSEVLVQNGKQLEKEFSLSSTDLFHSPSGFVQLSLSYSGASPDVMAISSIPSKENDTVNHDSESLSKSLARDLEKIEFPDPKIVNEDHLMASEYFGIPCDETQCSGSLADSDAENQSSEAGIRLVESFSACSVESIQPPKVDSPPSSVSTNGVSLSSSPAPASSETSNVVAASKSPSEKQVSGTKEGKNVDVKYGESDSSNGVHSDSFPKPVLTVSIEPEQPKVVQQEIVDMYMKSMQQFTESLAKMKLPMDIENEPTSSGNSSTDQKLPPSKNSSSRVFYGSRAFF